MTDEAETLEPTADEVAAIEKIEQDAAKRARIVQSLKLVKQEIDTYEANLTKARDRRQTLIDLALEGAANKQNLLSYDEVAEHSGVTRSAIYKIRRDDFKKPPLTQTAQ